MAIKWNLSLPLLIFLLLAQGYPTNGGVLRERPGKEKYLERLMEAIAGCFTSQIGSDRLEGLGSNSTLKSLLLSKVHITFSFMNQSKEEDRKPLTTYEVDLVSEDGNKVSKLEGKSLNVTGIEGSYDPLKGLESLSYVTEKPDIPKTDLESDGPIPQNSDTSLLKVTSPTIELNYPIKTQEEDPFTNNTLEHVDSNISETPDLDSAKVNIIPSNEEHFLIDTQNTKEPDPSTSVGSEVEKSSEKIPVPDVDAGGSEPILVVDPHTPAQESVGDSSLADSSPPTTTDKYTQPPSNLSDENGISSEHIPMNSTSKDWLGLQDNADSFHTFIGSETRNPNENNVAKNYDVVIGSNIETTPITVETNSNEPNNENTGDNLKEQEATKDVTKIPATTDHLIKSEPEIRKSSEQDATSTIGVIDEKGTEIPILGGIGLTDTSESPLPKNTHQDIQENTNTPSEITTLEDILNAANEKDNQKLKAIPGFEFIETSIPESDVNILPVHSEPVHMDINDVVSTPQIYPEGEIEGGDRTTEDVGKVETDNTSTLYNPEHIPTARPFIGEPEVNTGERFNPDLIGTNKSREEDLHQQTNPVDGEAPTIITPTNSITNGETREETIPVIDGANIRDDKNNLVPSPDANLLGETSARETINEPTDQVVHDNTNSPGVILNPEHIPSPSPFISEPEVSSNEGSNPVSIEINKNGDGDLVDHRNEPTENADVEPPLIIAPTRSINNGQTQPLTDDTSIVDDTNNLVPSPEAHLLGEMNSEETVTENTGQIVHDNTKSPGVTLSPEHLPTASSFLIEPEVSSNEGSNPVSIEINKNGDGDLVDHRNEPTENTDVEPPLIIAPTRSINNGQTQPLTDDTSIVDDTNNLVPSPEAHLLGEMNSEETVTENTGQIVHDNTKSPGVTLSPEHLPTASSFLSEPEVSSNEGSNPVSIEINKNGDGDLVDHRDEPTENTDVEPPLIIAPTRSINNGQTQPLTDDTSIVDDTNNLVPSPEAHLLGEMNSEETVTENTGQIVHDNTKSPGVTLSPEHLPTASSFLSEPEVNPNEGSNPILIETKKEGVKDLDQRTYPVDGQLPAITVPTSSIIDGQTHEETQPFTEGATISDGTNNLIPIPEVHLSGEMHAGKTDQVKHDNTDLPVVELNTEHLPTGYSYISKPEVNLDQGANPVSIETNKEVVKELDQPTYVVDGEHPAISVPTGSITDGETHKETQPLTDGTTMPDGKSNLVPSPEAHLLGEMSPGKTVVESADQVVQRNPEHIPSSSQFISEPEVHPEEGSNPVSNDTNKKVMNDFDDLRTEPVEKVYGEPPVISPVNRVTDGQTDRFIGSQDSPPGIEDVVQTPVIYSSNEQDLGNSISEMFSQVIMDEKQLPTSLSVKELEITHANATGKPMETLDKGRSQVLGDISNNIVGASLDKNVPSSGCDQTKSNSNRENSLEKVNPYSAAWEFLKQFSDHGNEVASDFSNKNITRTIYSNHQKAMFPYPILVHGNNITIQYNYIFNSPPCCNNQSDISHKLH